MNVKENNIKILTIILYYIILALIFSVAYLYTH